MTTAELAAGLDALGAVGARSIALLTSEGVIEQRQLLLVTNNASGRKKLVTTDPSSVRPLRPDEQGALGVASITLVASVAAAVP